MAAAGESGAGAAGARSATARGPFAVEIMKTLAALCEAPAASAAGVSTKGLVETRRALPDEGRRRAVQGAGLEDLDPQAAARKLHNPDPLTFTIKLHHLYPLTFTNNTTAGSLM